MLVFFASGNAKVISFALADAKVPNARYFAFWWNIGLSIRDVPGTIKLISDRKYEGKSYESCTLDYNGKTYRTVL